ncbi:MAG: 50S ribosomal protein L37ae [Candidatus Bathyarchaeota archaeon]|jgi:large subunit ribosomal protein L37Ae|nr:50S ribosomal protein L37ae [Candidatus Bathyarchaeota archaeon]
MPKKKTFGLRLRTRGGMSVRKQWTRITLGMRASHRCPRCSSRSVKRDSVGVWDCVKCGYRFAGGAYQPSTKTGQASMRIR